jgi:serine/threonine protein kinase
MTPLSKWLAPEILNGQLYDESIDVYSLSMVMLELLSGKEPFTEYHMYFYKVCLAPFAFAHLDVKPIHVARSIPCLSIIATLIYHRHHTGLRATALLT